MHRKKVMVPHFLFWAKVRHGASFSLLGEGETEKDERNQPACPKEIGQACLVLLITCGGTLMFGWGFSYQAPCCIRTLNV